MHPPQIIRDKEPYLEIFAGGMHMVELIVATWVFVQANDLADLSLT